MTIARPLLPTDQPQITAILGPTNTGKTWYALERMLGHDSGMIGFPLRLLARENYDRVCRIKGDSQVALLTGEEKIIPPSARYFLCTVEAMPLDRAVSFVGIDEIQLCADPERGHIFTDRLLHARGLYETAFMGAETMRGLIMALIPGVEIITRPRFSTLTCTGYRKVTRLPRRSAAIAFSIDDVYSLAELIRRQRGGTAVVLGALSPRTRNAQVELYQAGEVDYLVATDAIGMGLNMDIDHVAFASLNKFDGRIARRLRAPEVAQIAGRAGRHMRDGTFGTTADAGLLAPEIIEAVEHHRFDPITELQWRNSELDFRTPDRLIRSLESPPPRPELKKARMAEDQEVLLSLLQDDNIKKLVTTKDDTTLLWDVCQIPDFRKIMSDAHMRLCGQIFSFLQQNNRVLPHDWIATQVNRLDRTDGEIDTLMARLAHIRTWTYIAHRGDWLEQGIFWQEQTRSVEDRLSDVLHERLTQRFIDRRSAILMRRLDSGAPLLAAIRQNSEVIVEGEFVGILDGFRFVADQSTANSDDTAVITAARRALVEEIQKRVQQAEQDDDKQFSLGMDGHISWRTSHIARLSTGPGPYAPNIEILPTDLLDGGQRDRLHARCEKWLKQHIETILGPVLNLANLDSGGGARGVAFQIHEGMGLIPREQVADLIALLDKDQRIALHRAGVRLGPIHAFVPKTAKTHAVNLRAILWSLTHQMPLPAPVPPNGRTTIKPEPQIGKNFYHAIGYPVVGPLAIRVDILDRVIGQIHDNAIQGRFALEHRYAELLGCTNEELVAVLGALGYQRDNRPPPVIAPQQATEAQPTTEDTVSELSTTSEQQVSEPAEEIQAPTETTTEPTASEPAVDAQQAQIWYRLTRPSLHPRARHHGGRPNQDKKPPRQNRPDAGSDATQQTASKPAYRKDRPALRQDQADDQISAKKDHRPDRNKQRAAKPSQNIPHEQMRHSPFAQLKELVKK